MQDSLDAFIVQNLIDCSRMKFFFSDAEFEDIKFYEEPESVLTPMRLLKQKYLYLNAFSWQIELRPNNVADLLRIDNLAVSIQRTPSEEEEEVKPVSEEPKTIMKNASQR